MAPAPAPAPAVLNEQCACNKAEEELGCTVSKVGIREEHSSTLANNVASLADITAVFGAGIMGQAQRNQVSLTRIATTSFECLDDRVIEPSLSTPGGDLGEFILALASYFSERDPTGESKPTQETVDVLLLKYLETIPASRPMVHCTDDRAIAHLEAQLPAENLDLNAPQDQLKQAGLLDVITQVENQGDSHMRLMLKQPEWFQLNEYLVPLVLKSFYSQLWKQNQDPSSPLYNEHKLKLRVLTGTSDPQAFLEIASGQLCQNAGVAPMLTPHQGRRSLLISHLDAVSWRRQELATFFARIANATPRKINRDRLHQRLDRHGWLALETTGSRIAAGLPFYTLTYT